MGQRHKPRGTFKLEMRRLMNGGLIYAVIVLKNSCQRQFKLGVDCAARNRYVFQMSYLKGIFLVSFPIMSVKFKCSIRMEVQSGCLIEACLFA